LQRYATLAKQSYATQQQLDTQNALVSQLIAQIAADAAAIDAAQVQLDYTTIRAPITGRAGFRLVDEGNLVQASQQTGIVVIAQLQPISVIFTAPEDEVGKINALLTVEAPKVSVENTDGAKLATGKLAITDNQIDTTTGTIRLKAEFPNTDNALWPGLAVTTSLQVGIDKNAIVVPTAAIQHGQKGLYVYIVDDQNHAALRTIKVSHENTTVAVVSEGLKDGDRIVTSGQFLLQPGSAVTIDTSASGS
jgi:multidrug efflux system membrane fusion protein